MKDFRFAPVYPNIDQDRLEKVAKDTYKDLTYFGRSFLEFYSDSLDKSNSGINPFQAMNKLRRCYNLVRFFIEASSAEGNWAECGVFRGSTARLVVDIAQYGKIPVDNKKFYLFDSYEGLPELETPDLQQIELPEGNDSNPYYKETPRRFSNTSVEAVADIFTDAPWVTLRKGWIPERFEEVEDERYAFVHLDVDLYRSTLDCLKYFVPRMNPGGIILCDDYLALRFPGARMAWDSYCSENNINFITLDNYQSAIFF